MPRALRSLSFADIRSALPQGVIRCHGIIGDTTFNERFSHICADL